MPSDWQMPGQAPRPLGSGLLGKKRPGSALSYQSLRLLKLVLVLFILQQRDKHEEDSELPKVSVLTTKPVFLQVARGSEIWWKEP